MEMKYVTPLSLLAHKRKHMLHCYTGPRQNVTTDKSKAQCTLMWDVLKYKYISMVNYSQNVMTHHWRRSNK